MPAVHFVPSKCKVLDWVEDEPCFYRGKIGEVNKSDCLDSCILAGGCISGGMSSRIQMA